MKGRREVMCSKGSIGNSGSVIWFVDTTRSGMIMEQFNGFKTYGLDDNLSRQLFLQAFKVCYLE